MSRELAGQPAPIRKIVGEETEATLRLGVIEEVGRNFVIVRLGSSGNHVQVIVPEQMMLSQLVVGKRILCAKADRLSPWMAILTFDQPGRYSRHSKGPSGHASDHGHQGEDPFIKIGAEPAETFAGQLWWDTGVPALKVRNAADDGWLTA